MISSPASNLILITSHLHSVPRTVRQHVSRYNKVDARATFQDCLLAARQKAIHCLQLLHYNSWCCCCPRRLQGVKLGPCVDIVVRPLQYDYSRRILVLRRNLKALEPFEWPASQLGHMHSGTPYTYLHK